MDLPFSNEAIWHYVSSHTSPESSLLHTLNRETNLKAVHPRMLSGHYQGKLLEMFSLMIRPKRILEIGTYTGYSAICLAKGLRAGGKLITLEKNDEIVLFAKRFIDKAGYQDRIDIVVGDALSILPGLNTVFDLIFIDGDKTEYPDYYRLALPLLAPGGFMVADNVLWGGKVLTDSLKSDRETQAIMQFNNMVINDTSAECIMLPLRDGLILLRKKEI